MHARRRRGQLLGLLGRGGRRLALAGSPRRRLGGHDRGLFIAPGGEAEGLKRAGRLWLACWGLLVGIRGRVEGRRGRGDRRRRGLLLLLSGGELLLMV